MNVALFCPQIPANTGNIVRLCANTGAVLHIIHPLGFLWDDKRLIRAGLDYAEFARVHHHEDWQLFYKQMIGKRIWAITTHGQQSIFSVDFQADDILLFGNETAGLSRSVHDIIPIDQKLRIPIQASSRSLNLSNSVAVVLYEALRQSGLPKDPQLFKIN